MLNDRTIQFLFVAVDQSFSDRLYNGVQSVFHNAHVVYKRRVSKTEFDVRYVHGHSVHKVFADVDHEIVGRHGQHVQVRKRERISRVHRFAECRVRGREKHEHVRRYQMVFRDHVDFRLVAVRYSLPPRVSVHLADMIPVVQPKHDVQQYVGLYQHAQEREQLKGHGLFEMHDGHIRRGQIVERDRKFQVRQVNHDLAVGAPGHF